MRISLFQGRFQPPTILHEKIIKDQLQMNDVIIVQIVDGGKTSQEKDKNPFTYEERKEMLDKLRFKNKKIKIVRVTNGYLPNIIYEFYNKIDNLDGIDFFCGTDRVQGYQQQIDRSKELSDEQKGQFKIHEITRTDEDVSQSKLRNQLLNNNFKYQKDLTPDQLHNSLDNMQNKYQDRVRKYNINKEQYIGVKRLLLI